MAIFGYYVNCEERGEFRADVRAQDNRTLHEVVSDEDGEIWEIESGFMADPHDVSGLNDMLIKNGVLAQGDELLPAFEAEAHWEQANENAAESEHDVLGHDALLEDQATLQPGM